MERRYKPCGSDSCCYTNDRAYVDALEKEAAVVWRDPLEELPRPNTTVAVLIQGTRAKSRTQTPQFTQQPVSGSASATYSLANGKPPQLEAGTKYRQYRPHSAF